MSDFESLILGPDSPMDYVLNRREEPIVETVRRAMRNRNVLLAYQPVVLTQNPEKASFHEGLMRILDDNGETIPAKDFIEECEMLELGRYIDTVAIEIGLMTLAQSPDLRLSINMSARSIGYPKWMQALEIGLARDATIAERLILEITERSAMLVPDLVTVFMSDLRRKGISFALDDFGAGYTAFRFFKEFQFDILKIDGQFIHDIHKDTDNQVLLDALISIGKNFDMYTVAEMVEKPEELAYLQMTGVDCVQGFHTGRPETLPTWRVDRVESA